MIKVKFESGSQVEFNTFVDAHRALVSKASCICHLGETKQSCVRWWINIEPSVKAAAEVLDGVKAFDIKQTY